MVMPKVADVVVVGGGVMGLSTAYYLARRGCRNVVVLEAERYLGGQTTKRCGGGIRHQFSSRIHVQMSILSVQMLNAFEEETGHSLNLSWDGYLFVLTKEDDMKAIERAVELQHFLGVETEMLSSESVQTYVPMMDIEDAVGATFYHYDGTADPSKVTSGYAMAAQQAGVVFFTSSPVIGIHVGGGRVRHVKTPQGNIATPIVVNAAGPWSAQISRMVDVALPLLPIRHQVFVTRLPPGLPADFPTVIFPTEDIGFRRSGGGLLVGTSNWKEKPNFDQEHVDMNLEAELRKRAEKRLPCLKQVDIVSHWVGLYEMTPDMHPILGHVPSVKGFYCIAGFSGHGFMHAPISGLLLSEEILDEKAHTLDITPLRIDRFSQM